jgi:hypothetical protein
MVVVWVAACTSETGVLDRDVAPPGGERVDDVRPPPGDHAAAVHPIPPAAPEDADDGERILYGDEIVELRFDVSSSAQSDLEKDPLTDVPVDVTWEGETWRDVGMQLKGSASFRDFSGKAAFKLDFGEFVEDQDFRGVRRVTLNNMLSDESMLREHVYYWLCAQLRLPAPRHGYARVYVNDELYGLYGVVETMDKHYVEEAWPEDPYGNLYEGQAADLTWERDWYALQVDGGVAPVEEDVAALIDVLETASAAEHLDVLSREFDRDALFGYLAVDAMSSHFDGYIFNRNNYLLYHAPWTHRWYLSPWGVDQAFRRDLDVFGHGSPIAGELLRECLDDSACQAVYADALLTVATIWESADPAALAREQWAKIEAECETDPRRERACDPAELLEFLERRPADVRAMVSGS